jgi:hypothetical protein
MRRAAVIIPRHVVAKLGKGDHANGAALLDGFLQTDSKPIEWHEGEPGDYVVRHEDAHRCGKGNASKGLKLLSRLIKDHA